MSESLQARVAARRQDLIARRSKGFTVPVPEFEGMLALHFRLLEFEEKRAIHMRHDGVGTDPGDEVAASADLLIAACDGVLEVHGDSEPSQYAPGLSAQVVRDLFGLSDLPESLTVRQALIAALGSDGVMALFGRYSQEVSSIRDEAEDAAEGESTPAVAG